MSIDLQDNWAKDKRKDLKKNKGRLWKNSILIVYNKK